MAFLNGHRPAMKVYIREIHLYKWCFFGSMLTWVKGFFHCCPAAVVTSLAAVSSPKEWDDVVAKPTVPLTAR